LNQFLVIALGGSLGAMTRFWVANTVYTFFGRDFPHGTLFINVSGSFLMGFLTEVMLQRFPVSVEYRAAILIGFLGAYTTFSSFAIETYYLIEQGTYLKAIANIFLSVLLCIGAVWIGLVWARTLFEGSQISWASHEQAYWVMALGWLFLFILTTAASILATHEGWSTTHQSIGLITLLGLSTIASTLWMSLKLSSIDIELGELFTLFSLNGLFAGSALWSASRLGNWICRLYLSL
jgi:CrcB protein